MEENESNVTNIVRECMLTTHDNPYDPFTQYDRWLMYDNEKGYGSAAYLARIADTSNSMSDQELNAEIERAIDEIIKHDFLNIYKKVVKEVDEKA